MELETADQQTPHVILLPNPWIGHIIPLAELAKRLILHNFTVTFTIPTYGNPSKAQQDILDALPKPFINYIYLTPIDFTDLPNNATIETRIGLTASRSLPSLRETLKVFSATHRLVALVVDVFGTDAFDVAKEFNISPYLFFPSTAMLLSLALHLPKLDEVYNGEYRDMLEPLKLPGCVPILGTDLVDPMQDRSSDGYKLFLHHSKRYRMAEGILINTFMGLEVGALKALEDGSDPTIPPVYPVGPLIQMGSRVGVDDRVECLQWLDDQPTGSVLFVSFGSGGTLSMEQQNELALGLELSEQKFLWVIRNPTQTSANVSYLNAQGMQDPFDFLPEGFLERTKGKGLVVPSWAPQIEVLSHGSTGGFITHCGWNSILESVVHGVPLIAWPLYAEQRMNSRILVEDLKVALRLRVEENGIVGRAVIASTLKCLMEGEEGKRIRNQMRVLQASTEKVPCEDGYTPKSLSKIAQKWKSQLAI
ncbi:hydroquinone glucosyltransferase-like [Macadamia integrifolia]|uniref:hydroquinone glucosyltransferase-like n=1 Tax=Macadamia integrifolia TaxID=60698 RepID=UPI001C5276CF|nr:hydroquinone glucosyltransferase-like [Macadamia integrifolia]